MTVTYYTYNGEHNRLNKTAYLTEISSASGVPVGPVDVISPTVLIEAAAPAAANYAYIDTFESYYWITEISRDSDTQSVLSLRRDPLMTFCSDILACNCVCARNETQYNGDFPDSIYSVLQGKYIETYAFPSLSNNDAIVFAFVE